MIHLALLARRRRGSPVWMLWIKVPLLLLIVALQIMRLRDISQRMSLRQSGETCVAYGGIGGIQIMRHWKPRRDSIVTYCPIEDYPAGVTVGDVGQL